MSSSGDAQISIGSRSNRSGVIDHVDHAGFVFEREEHEALGGAGTLTADHQSCHRDPFAIAAVLMRIARGAARRSGASIVAQVLHGMAGQ